MEDQYMGPNSQSPTVPPKFPRIELQHDTSQTTVPESYKSPAESSDANPCIPSSPTSSSQSQQESEYWRRRSSVEYPEVPCVKHLIAWSLPSFDISPGSWWLGCSRCLGCSGFLKLQLKIFWSPTHVIYFICILGNEKIFSLEIVSDEYIASMLERSWGAEISSIEAYFTFFICPLVFNKNWQALFSQGSTPQSRFRIFDDSGAAKLFRPRQTREQCKCSLIFHATRGCSRAPAC